MIEHDKHTNNQVLQNLEHFDHGTTNSIMLQYIKGTDSSMNFSISL